jgi:hypothetical protein
MKGRLSLWPILPAVLVLVGFGGPLTAGDLYDKDSTHLESVALPKPAEVRALATYPTKISLRGGDDAQQLILTATLTDGRSQDLSGDVKFEVANSKIARVSTTGRVVPLANGDTEITASYGDRAVKITVHAESVDINLPINFTNQIVPIFTKLGCNSGGCHGKASGQNGFKLSLLGFEPDVDYSALVKEARGRRLFPASPEHSLLLLKAGGQLAHGGGKRMEVGSDEYRLIRRWIAAGTPRGLPEDPVVTRISIYPEHRILPRQNKQQFAVYAHYSDGSVEDVTRRAQYDSNDKEVAEVDSAGLVRTLSMSGEAAVMARYQGHVATFRATVPLGVKIPDYAFLHQTVVDAAVHKKWQQLGLLPSELCSDEQFIRRISLDIIGTLPTPAQLTAFVTSQDPQKLIFCASSGAASRTGPPAPSPSTSGFARRLPRTSRMTSSLATSWPPPATRIRTRRRCGTRNCKTRSSSWTTRPRSSSACALPAPSATTIRMKNGARTITGVWPLSSAGWVARTSLLWAAS